MEVTILASYKTKNEKDTFSPLKIQKCGCLYIREFVYIFQWSPSTQEFRRFRLFGIVSLIFYVYYQDAVFRVFFHVPCIFRLAWSTKMLLLLDLFNAM